MVSNIIEAVPPGSKGVVIQVDSDSVRNRRLYSYYDVASVRVYWIVTKESYWIMSDDIRKVA